MRERDSRHLGSQISELEGLSFEPSDVKQEAMDKTTSTRVMNLASSASSASSTSSTSSTLLRVKKKLTDEVGLLALRSQHAVPEAASPCRCADSTSFEKNLLETLCIACWGLGLRAWGSSGSHN